MKKIAVKNKNGFTIIEIVLVLAIAGLIFLMVFLALPALQRAQLNQQYKNNLSMVIGVLQSYRSNNKGKRAPETDPKTYRPSDLTTYSDAIDDSHPIKGYFDKLDFSATVDNIKIYRSQTADISFSSWGLYATESRIMIFYDKSCPEQNMGFRRAILKHTPGKNVGIVVLAGVNQSQGVETRDAQIYCQEF